jgi:hypothetical protein
MNKGIEDITNMSIDFKTMGLPPSKAVGLTPIRYEK